MLITRQYEPGNGEIADAITLNSLFYVRNLKQMKFRGN